MRFYLLDVYKMDTGETLVKTGFPSRYACLNHVKELEKETKMELDYFIKEVYFDEAADVCDK